MTNEEKCRKGKNKQFYPTLSAMNERNMEIQRVRLRTAFVRVSVPPHPETTSNSEPPGTTTTKPKGTGRREDSLGLELGHQP